MSITLGIQGSTGRTGKLLLEVLHEFPQITLSKLRNFDGSISELLDGSGAKVWIDFSTPEATLQLLDIAIKENSALVIATTGFSTEQELILKSASEYIPILYVQNTSLGIFALNEAIKEVLKVLPDGWDIKISEKHHSLKKDAPSGTAKFLLNNICSQLPKNRSKEEVDVSFIRGGDIVGEHTVYLISNGERLEFTHIAWDRKIYARGALNLALKLVDLPKGWYLPQNLLKT